MSDATAPDAASTPGVGNGSYKWVALSNTTLGMLAATVVLRMSYAGGRQ